MLPPSTQASNRVDDKVEGCPAGFRRRLSPHAGRPRKNSELSREKTWKLLRVIGASSAHPAVGGDGRRRRQQRRRSDGKAPGDHRRERLRQGRPRQRGEREDDNGELGLLAGESLEKETPR